MIEAARVEAWVFDLDNTLYPAECDLFAQIDVRMTAYVQRLLGLERDAALAVQKAYYRDHGTTLAGLMALHGVDAEDFLHAVHDIDYAPVAADAALARALTRLRNRRLIFTNGSRGHARRVTDRLGVSDLFHGVCAIEDTGYRPKPTADSFARLIEMGGFEPSRAVLFDDLPRNLEAAKALGFTTVLVRSGKDWSHEPEEARPAGLDQHPDCADFVCERVAEFLARIDAPAAAV